MQGADAQGTDVPIAVIGMAARAAGAPGLTGLWRLLETGHSAITEIPADRLPGRDSEAGAGPPKAGLLDRIDTFDAEFFGISPRQTAFMDPRQRLLLEETWHALEDAGLSPDRLAGSGTGVFVGSSGPDYRQRSADLGAVDQYTAPGTGEAFLANRLSYHFDWHGTSLHVDTACSAGLTAVCQALGSLASGQVDLAVAAGASVICHGYGHQAYHLAGLLSPTGTVSLFSDAANGYVRGEGVAVVVLKRLADAERDGDPVRAVILGYAQSHDGRAGGQFAPDADIQASLISRATQRSGVTPSMLGYIEAHATGTQAGDLAEAKGVAQALAGAGAAGPDGRLWLGSGKANIGHTEGAAGVFGLVKAVLVLENERIPPIPGFRAPMAGIPAQAPLGFPAATVPWPATAAGRRLAGVSSFGIGGANAHVVLAEAPARAPAGTSSGPGRWLFPLSAASPTALASLAGELAGWLESHPGADTGAVAWTLQTGRRHLAYRAVLVGATAAEIVTAARTLAGNAVPAPAADSVPAAARNAVRDFLTGQCVDWPALWDSPHGMRRIPLVPYPFQPHSHWLRAEQAPKPLPPRPEPPRPEPPRPQASPAGAVPAGAAQAGAGNGLPLVRLRPVGDYIGTTSAAAPAPVTTASALAPAPGQTAAAPAPTPVPTGSAPAGQIPPAPSPAAPAHRALVPPVASPPVPAAPAGTGPAGGTARAGGATPGGASPDGVSPGGVSLGGVSPGGVSLGGVSPGGVSLGGASPGGVSRDGASGASPGGAGQGGSQELEKLIMDAVAEVLYLPEGQLGLDDDFIAAGLDSILAVEFVQLLQSRAGAELTTEQLYQTRSARALAQEILAGQASGQGQRQASGLGQATDGGPALAAASVPVAPSISMAPPATAVPLASSAAPASPAASAGSATSAGSAPPSAVPPGTGPIAGNGTGTGTGTGTGNGHANGHANGSEASRDLLTARLRAMVGECLYLPADNIEPDAEFTAMGLDSVLAVEFVSRVKNELGATLTVEALHEHPTVTRLTGHLLTSAPELVGGLAR